MRVLAIMLLVVCCCVPLNAEDSVDFDSYMAKSARNSYEKEMSKLRKDYAKRTQSICLDYIKDLDKAIKSAMKKGDLEEANRINAAKKEVEDLMEQSANPDEPTGGKNKIRFTGKDVLKKHFNSASIDSWVVEKGWIKSGRPESGIFLKKIFDGNFEVEFTILVEDKGVNQGVVFDNHTETENSMIVLSVLDGGKLFFFKGKGAASPMFDIGMGERTVKAKVFADRIEVYLGKSLLHTQKLTGACPLNRVGMYTHLGKVNIKDFVYKGK